MRLKPRSPWITTVESSYLVQPSVLKVTCTAAAAAAAAARREIEFGQGSVCARALTQPSRVGARTPGTWMPESFVIVTVLSPFSLCMGAASLRRRPALGGAVALAMSELTLTFSRAAPCLLTLSAIVASARCCVACRAAMLASMETRRSVRFSPVVDLMRVSSCSSCVFCCCMRNQRVQ
eukprot:7380678-Prymnesium_polylepis.1